MFSLSIRSFIGIVLSVCLVGGLAATQYISSQHREVDRLNQLVGADSLVSVELQQLKSGIQQYILTIDLILAEEESYLVQSIGAQQEWLSRSFDSVRSSPLIDDPSLIDQMDKQVRSVREYLDEWSLQALNENDSSGRINALINEVDPITGSLVSIFQNVKTDADNKAIAAVQKLENYRRQVNATTLLAVGSYGATVLLLWYWSTRFVGSPLARLSAAGQASLDLGKPFNPRSHGPKEIAQVGHQLSVLITNLEQKVKQRTHALSEQNRELDAAKTSADQARQAAEASNRAKSTFLATMSHEIRTPLNGVIGMADLLKATNLSEKQAHYCRTIVSSSNDLLAILNDILDLSKIEAGYLNIEMVPTSVSELVQNVHDLFLPLAAAKQLELRRSGSIPDDLNVMMDSKHVRQVLSNLVSNGIKFTENGSVDLIVNEQSTADGAVSIQFEIRDTGIGMDSDAQLSVFDSFSQADGSMSRRYGGTGLGLTISKHIVETFGGKLNVESALDRGSRFWFELEFSPANEDPSSVVTISSPKVFPGTAPSICLDENEQKHNLTLRPGRFEGVVALLAEDNAVNSEVARESLRSLGIEVVTACDGSDAVKKYKELSPNLVFMDCQMPIVDGYEATQMIRDLEADSGRRTPIIALSANALQGDAEKCIAIGMDDFIAKPFNVADLQATIQCWLSDSFVEATDAITPLDISTENAFSPVKFDQNALDSLRLVGQSGDAEFINKVVALYCDQTPGTIAEIARAWETRSFADLRLHAHSLKSASASVGAIEVSKLCADLEAAGVNKHTNLPFEIDTLKFEFDAARTWLVDQQRITRSPPNDVVDRGDSNGKRVLIVDDDPIFRLTTSEALSNAGFSTAVADNGYTAIEMASHEPPNLIILDAIMPDFDGFETCATLKNQAGFANVPILMATGLDDAQSVDKAYKAGASGFVTKPIHYPMLSHHVRFLIRASETEKALSTSKQRLATAQRMAALGYWIWNSATDEFLASEEVCSMVAKNDLDSIEDWTSFAEEIDRKGMLVDIQRIVADGHDVEQTYRISTANNSTRYIHQHLTLDANDTQSATVVATVQDITDKQSAEQRVRFLAYFDPLTGLANRASLYERLGSAIKSATRRDIGFALLFLDLDGFKDVNDTMGHEAGDELLTTIAIRLRESVRENDFVARFGGDEFCIVLEDATDDLDISNTAARFLEVVEQRIQFSTRSIQPQVSIGISRFPDDGQDLTSLLSAADSAMYRAKENGKHCFEFFDPAIADVNERRFVLAQELRDAMRLGQFELYYQPQIGLVSGSVESSEALVRWNHPERGLVSPAEFIPELERLGMIDDLGEWAILDACGQLERWINSGMTPIRVCVNISATHFQKPTLVSTVKEAISRHNIDPEFFEVEVTESAFQYTEESRGILDSLKEIGVAIAIDDFGSGFSSLGSLQHLRVDCLKIDRMFIRDLMNNPKDAVLLGSIMTLAHALGFKVVAEGVEEIQQVQILNSLGCDLIQGFYFSRPVPADEIPGLVSQSFLPAFDSGAARLSKLA